MSNRPDEALLDAVADAPVLAAAVEAHLDAFPLPVDEDEILASAERLEARLGARPANEPVRWWLIAGVALAAAAAIALMAVPRSPVVTEAPQAVPRVEVMQSTTPAVLERIETNQAELELELESVERTLTLDPETKMISSQAEGSAVLLVQQGKVHDDQVEVPAGHWGVFGRSDGKTDEVVFKDGERPPELDPEVFDVPQVQQQLREVRWEAMPDRTRETLDRLLEER